MRKYSFEKIRELLLKCIQEQNCEAELSLFFPNNPHEYMIIIYNDHCSFQRCGALGEQSGESNYRTLEELYHAQQVDDIILARDWDNIQSFDCMDFDAFGYWNSII